MSNIPALAKVPEVSFIENLSLAEVVELAESEYRQAYKDITGKAPTLAPADPVSLILKTIAMLHYQNLQYNDQKGKQELLKYSTGAGLDNLAALRGLTRKEAERATVVVRFNLSSAGQAGAVGIPAGTRVKTATDIYFNTLDYAEIEAGELYADVLCQAEIAGASANGIAIGVIDTLVDPIPYVSGIENISASGGGNDTESDDSLTERIFLGPSSYSCAGPKEAYEYYVKAFRNDIADVKITNPSPCVVEICFMLAGGVLPDEVARQSMAEYLNDEKIRPLCDLVRCIAPEEIDYDIALTYTIARSDASSAVKIQTDVTRAIEDYKVWQRTMGRDVNPTELIARIRNAGAKRVSLTAPVDVAITDTQVPRLANCAVTYGGMEDD